MSDKQLVAEDFADKIGQVFAIREEGAPAMALMLRQVEPMDSAMAAGRPPFSLIFEADDPRVLAQRIYRMEHDGLGELSIFLVPIGKNKDGVSYQAVFN